LIECLKNDCFYQESRGFLVFRIEK
jgi:hypothetical protein